MYDSARVEKTARQVIESHDPRAVSTPEFLGACFDAGLSWVHFPEGMGGLGVSRGLQARVDAILQGAGGPAPFPLNPIGYGMAAPTVLEHGSPELARELLRPLATTEHIWCQLFSEPGAGSDLASLACRAERDGDEFVINGQKVWNSSADVSDWGMLLARTDPDVPKHRGLTMFILPMDAEGVSVRPLRQISGEAHFNEVFLDDVRLEPGSEVGPVDGGWGVAMTTLMFERMAIGLGGEGFGWRADRFATALIEDEAATRDREVRHRFGAIAAEFLALRFTSFRTLTTLQRGGKTTAAGACRARRCGPPTRSTPRSACCWRARTPTSPSTTA